MSIGLVMLSNHLILCLPHLLLLSVFTSIRVFSNVQALHIRWPKYWSFSFSISPFNEYSGLICFRIDGFDLLAVQGTLKNLWWWRKLKASILRHSAFFTVQLSHLYMTTEKKHSFNYTDICCISEVVDISWGLQNYLMFCWAIKPYISESLFHEIEMFYIFTG